MRRAAAGQGSGGRLPGGTATFYCPGCGVVHSLIEFKIAADGTVAPSFVCSMHERDRCFHDSVVLVEWAPSV